MQSATVSAESTVIAQASNTSIANTASGAAVNAEKELAKVGINGFEGEFTFNRVNNLAPVNLTSKATSGIWSSTKSIIGSTKCI